MSCSLGLSLEIGAGASGAEPFQLEGAGTQTYSFTGSVSGQLCTGRVYLPAGYDPDAPDRYPIILAMHGKGGSSNTTNTSFIPSLEAAITATQIRKCIVVMPDSVGADWAQDAFDGSVKAETKIIDDVLPYFLAHTRNNGVIVATGFSMGGRSVTTLAMKHVGTFAAVWPVACPNMDANPAANPPSGNANNWRFINNVFTDLGANDTDDIQAIYGPTGTVPEQEAVLAALEAASPLASRNGGALANQFTASIISSLPLFYCKSAGDATSQPSLDKMTEGYTALGIPHGFVDLVSPTHSMSGFYSTAQAASTIAAGNGFMWLEAKFAGSDVIAPKLVSAAVASDGASITLTFDKTLSTNSPTASQFTLGGTFATVASAVASGTTVTLTLATTGLIAAGATITVSIASAAAAVKIQSAAGVPAAPLASVAVTNNSTVTPLTLVTSVSFYTWVRSDLGVTTATGVSAWNDQSGAARHFTQATGGNQPALTATGAPGSRPAIDFDGTDDFLASVAIDLPAPATTNFYELMYVRQDSWTSLDRITARPGGNMRVQQSGASPQLQMANTTAVNTNGGLALNTWGRVSAKFTGSTSDELRASATTVTGASAGTNDPASGAITLGAVVGGTNAADVSFAEYMAFAGTPNATEISNLDKYLFGLYGQL